MALFKVSFFYLNVYAWNISRYSISALVRTLNVTRPTAYGAVPVIVCLQNALSLKVKVDLRTPKRPYAYLRVHRLLESLSVWNVGWNLILDGSIRNSESNSYGPLLSCIFLTSRSVQFRDPKPYRQRAFRADGRKQTVHESLLLGK